MSCATIHHSTGCGWSVVCYMSLPQSLYILNLVDFLSSFITRCCLFFVKFSPSLLGCLPCWGLWVFGFSVGVCSVECNNNNKEASKSFCSRQDLLCKVMRGTSFCSMTHTHTRRTSSSKSLRPKSR